MFEYSRAGSNGEKVNNERESKKYRHGDETEAGGRVKNKYVCRKQLVYDYDIGRWGK